MTSSPATPAIFKRAEEAWEFELIHQLNHKTFAEEIPQHSPSPDERLIDKFHGENIYFICLRDEQLLGMVAVRDQRPFSLDFKLDNLDSYLPPHRAVCEIRLLAVEQDHRSPRIFQGLVLKLSSYCEQQGYDLAVMSGTTRQLKLYSRLGFKPFGPLVGAAQARFQPMYITLDMYRELKDKNLAYPH